MFSMMGNPEFGISSVGSFGTANPIPPVLTALPKSLQSFNKEERPEQLQKAIKVLKKAKESKQMKISRKIKENAKTATVFANQITLDGMKSNLMNSIDKPVFLKKNKDLIKSMDDEDIVSFLHFLRTTL